MAKESVFSQMKLSWNSARERINCAVVGCLTKGMCLLDIGEDDKQ